MRYVLYGLIVFAFLDNFSQLPVISPFALSLGASSMMIGFIVGMYSLTNMIGNVLAGRWIDRYGAKKVLIAGMLATAITLLFYTMINTPEQLLSVRLIHGLTGGLLAPSVFTLVSHNLNQGTRGRSMALTGAAVGIAAVIGPAYGGIMKAKFGVDAVFLSVAIILGVVSLMTALFITHKVDQAGSKEEGLVQGSQPMLSLLKNPYALQAYLGAFTLMYMMGVLTTMLPLKIEGLQLSERLSGILFSIQGTVAILLFMLPTNRIFDRVAPRTTMMVGIGLIAVSVFTLSFFSQEIAIMLCMAVYGVGFALIFPSMNTLILDHVQSEDRGKAFGILYSFYSIGVVVGSFSIGIITGSPDVGLRLASGVMLVMVLTIYALDLSIQKRSARKSMI